MSYRTDAIAFSRAMKTAGVKEGSPASDKCVAALEALSAKGGGNPADFVRSMAGPRGKRRSVKELRREAVSNLQEMGLVPFLPFPLLWIAERILMRVLWHWIESVLTDMEAK